MTWYISAGIIFIVALILLGMNFWRDRRYLRQKTSTTMNAELWLELEQEQAELQRKKKSFEAALKAAQGKTMKDRQ